MTNERSLWNRTPKGPLNEEEELALTLLHAEFSWEFRPFFRLQEGPCCLHGIFGIFKFFDSRQVSHTCSSEASCVEPKSPTKTLAELDRLTRRKKFLTSRPAMLRSEVLISPWNVKISEDESSSSKSFGPTLLAGKASLKVAEKPETETIRHCEGGCICDTLEPMLLAKKGLTARAVVYEADLGLISITALAAVLNADDWESNNGPLGQYFKASGASSLKISPWTNGSIVASTFQGKVRSSEMRVPVPPAPMCPKETLCTSTWHLTSSSSKVLLESAVMCPDVPYGRSFNVVRCDAFHVDRNSGRLRFIRTMAVEWLKSCWAKSLVESNIPNQLREDGQRLATVVKQWSYLSEGKIRSLGSLSPSASTTCSETDGSEKDFCN